MTTREKIIELSEKWYEYVSCDHHKDCDCHWIIETDFAYGDEPVFTAQHYGYIAHDLEGQPKKRDIQRRVSPYDSVFARLFAPYKRFNPLRGSRVAPPPL